MVACRCILICRIRCACEGQSGWHSATVRAGGSARARVSARRRASDSRYWPAMPRTRSPRRPGHPGRGDEQRVPRGSAHDRHCVDSRAELGLGHPPITGMPNSACACAPRPTRPLRLDRRSRRPPAGPARSDPPGPCAAAGARADSTRPAGRAAPGVLSRCVRPDEGEGGIGCQVGCRPGTAGAQVMHVHRGAHAELQASAGFHVLRMPEPAPAAGPCARYSYG